MKNNSILRLSVSGLLVAVGIIIPMFSPIKIILEPASFTLASHAAIFIAMFVSPGMAAAVAAGTTAGFFLGGFPIVVVLRAASHIIFAIGGALYLNGRLNKAPLSAVKLRVFSFFIALIHAICELAVVSAFYYGGNVSDAYYKHGFFLSVLLLVGIGTVIHSMIDFEIAYIIVLVLRKEKTLKKLIGKI